MTQAVTQVLIRGGGINPKCSLRLSEDEVVLLQQLMQQWGTNKTDTIKRALVQATLALVTPSQQVEAKCQAGLEVEHFTAGHCTAGHFTPIAAHSHPSDPQRTPLCIRLTSGDRSATEHELT